MAKAKSIYECNACGFQESKWVGRCSSCEAWNSFAEKMPESVKRLARGIAVGKARETMLIPKNPGVPAARITSGISEFDRVLGGGLVAGELLLIGGNPGIGKSTLLLQLVAAYARQGIRVLYVSGEESIEQIGMRANRLGLDCSSVSFLDERDMATVIATLDESRPDLVIIDSIQVLTADGIGSGGAGTVSQVRYCTEQFLAWTKTMKKPLILVGHVTKDGTLAGPRTLEHMVDAALQLEGERTGNFRILRGLKNRFGNTDEVGIFEMTASGMQEVKNPAGFFIEDKEKTIPGQAIVTAMQGTRPLLVEVQALVTKSPFGYPVRKSSGFDVNRLQLLLAVIQNSLKIDLAAHDVFINVVGGLHIKDPAADLGIVMAIVSAYKGKALPPRALCIGEVTLSGELRRVRDQEKRAKEAGRLGYAQIVGTEKSSHSLAGLVANFF